MSIRGSLVLAAVSFYFLILGPTAVLTLIFDRSGKWVTKVTLLWSWLILKTARVKLKVRGSENVNEKKTYVIISNHQSHFDIPAISLSLPMLNPRWIVKMELRRIPVFGWCVDHAGHIFIDRSNHVDAAKTINRSYEKLRNGISAIFFAEGTRSPDGKIHEFKKGGFVMAIEAGIPVLPVTVKGSRDIHQKNGKDVKPGTIEVVISPPVETSTLAESEKNPLRDRVREIIVKEFEPQ